MLALAAAGAAVVAFPHLMRLERVAPALGIAVWGAALALRALLSVFAALVVVLALAHTPVVDAIAHWCLETVVPGLALHFDLEGHELGDAATALPAVLVGSSALAVLVGAARAARAIRAAITGHAVGRGPRDSVVVCGQEVLLGSTGLARPRVVVSAGALLALDDDELAAGLAHEEGHIARRHRYVLLFAEGCRGLGRFLPGTRQAARQLVFHLERDADRWAIARHHAPEALASAICKAGGAHPTRLGYAALDGGRVAERLGQLLEPDRNGVASRTGPVRLLAATMLAIALALSAALPGTALAGLDELAREHPGESHCHDHRH